MRHAEVTTDYEGDQDALPRKGDSSESPSGTPDEKQPDILDAPEIEALLAAPNVDCATGLRDRCMMELMVRSGLRISEVTAVRRRDIKWDDYMLVLPRTKGGKTRTVPLLDDTIAWLRRWDERRRNDPRLGGEFFFCTLKKGRVDHSQVRAMFKRRACKAQLPGWDAPKEEKGLARVHPHALRHSFAVAFLRAGGNIRELQTLLGHESVATTEIYTKVRPKDLVKKFREIMEPGQEG